MLCKANLAPEPLPCALQLQAPPKGARYASPHCLGGGRLGVSQPEVGHPHTRPRRASSFPTSGLFSGALLFSQLVTAWGSHSAWPGLSVDIHPPACLGPSGMAGAGVARLWGLGWPPTDPGSSGPPAVRPPLPGHSSSLSHWVMTQEWGLDAPNLLISVIMGQGLQHEAQAEECFPRGLPKVAQTQVQQGQRDRGPDHGWRSGLGVLGKWRTLKAESGP